MCITISLKSILDVLDFRTHWLFLAFSQDRPMLADECIDVDHDVNLDLWAFALHVWRPADYKSNDDLAVPSPSAVLTRAARVEVLRQRYECGERLWHHQDRVSLHDVAEPEKHGKLSGRLRNGRANPNETWSMEATVSEGLERDRIRKMAWKELGAFMETVEDDDADSTNEA